MFRRAILSTLLAIQLALVGVASSAGPASASPYCDNLGICGVVIHYSPDDGYDPPFLVRCNFGDPSSNRYVYEGQTSKSYCKDTDQIYINSGARLVCIYYLGGYPKWEVVFDSTGWHKIGDDFGRTCVYQLD